MTLRSHVDCRAAAVLQQFTKSPDQLKRVLDRLPTCALSQESYRRLFELLNDPPCMRILKKTEKLSDRTLEIVAGAPAPLRPVVLCLADVMRVDDVLESLAYLAVRTNNGNLDVLAEKMAGLHQVGQISAFIKHLIERLPILEKLPPANLQNAHRIDCPIELRSLARKWKSCVTNYLYEVEQGVCAIYLWDDGNGPACCAVPRRGRLGWFLDEVKGPKNINIASERMKAIQEQFAGAGIERNSIYQAIEAICQATQRRRLHQMRSLT